jgi:hypothetical protein
MLAGLLKEALEHELLQLDLAHMAQFRAEDPVEDLAVHGTRRVLALPAGQFGLDADHLCSGRADHEIRLDIERPLEAAHVLKPAGLFVEPLGKSADCPASRVDDVTRNTASLRPDEELVEPRNRGRDIRGLQLPEAFDATEQFEDPAALGGVVLSEPRSGVSEVGELNIHFGFGQLVGLQS